ncbi:MAG: nucleotidyltransferase domain-containing protein [Anaerolineae bacterium]
MNQEIKLPVYQSEIEQFCRLVEAIFQPDCIILHGSVTRDTYTQSSDIDIVVIGGRLPDNFLERIYELNCLRDGTAPIEVVGYTLSEWEQMLERLHLTVLEALHWGIPLHGQALFKTWKTRLEEWKSIGLRRKTTSWSIPPALQRQMS